MEYFLNTVVEVLDIHGEVFILVMTIAMSVFLVDQVDDGLISLLCSLNKRHRLSKIKHQARLNRLSHVIFTLG